MVATQKDKLVADGKVKVKRPHNYWAPFTSWWRNQYEATGKRATTEAVRQWYVSNVHTFWSAEELPAMDELLKLSKGMRSLQQVKEYFRTYRRARRDQDTSPRKPAARGRRPAAAGKAADDNCGSSSITHCFTATDIPATPSPNHAAAVAPKAATNIGTSSSGDVPTQSRRSPGPPPPSGQPSNAQMPAAAATIAVLSRGSAGGTSICTSPDATAAAFSTRTSADSPCAFLNAAIATAAVAAAVTTAPSIPDVITPTSARSVASVQPQVYVGSSTTSHGGSEDTQYRQGGCTCEACRGGQWRSCDTMQYNTNPEPYSSTLRCHAPCAPGHSDGICGPYGQHETQYGSFHEPHTPASRRVRQPMYWRPAAGWYGVSAPGMAPPYYSYSSHPAYPAYHAPYTYGHDGYGYGYSYALPQPPHMAHKPSLPAPYQPGAQNLGPEFGGMSSVWPSTDPTAGHEHRRPIGQPVTPKATQAMALPVSEAVLSTPPHPAYPASYASCMSAPDAHGSYGGVHPGSVVDTAEGAQPQPQPQPTDLEPCAAVEGATAGCDPELMMADGWEVDAAVDVYLTWITKHDSDSLLNDE